MVYERVSSKKSEERNIVIILESQKYKYFKELPL